MTALELFAAVGMPLILFVVGEKLADEGLIGRKHLPHFEPLDLLSRHPSPMIPLPSDFRCWGQTPLNPFSPQARHRFHSQDP